MLSLKELKSLKLFQFGELVGLKIFTKGVLIVGFSEIEDINGNKISLEKTSSLKQGEKILEVNGVEINNIEDLKKVISYNMERIKFKNRRTKWKN